MPGAVSFSSSPLPGVSALPEIGIGDGHRGYLHRRGCTRRSAARRCQREGADDPLGSVARPRRGDPRRTGGNCPQAHGASTSRSCRCRRHSPRTPSSRNASARSALSSSASTPQMVERSGIKRRRRGCRRARAWRSRCDRGGGGSRSIRRRSTRRCASSARRSRHSPWLRSFGTQSRARQRARERIRASAPNRVTCSHELSSQLDAPKRALTAALNARLTPQIRDLLDALGRVLEREGICAPVMVVKGDGTLMQGRGRPRVPGRDRPLGAGGERRGRRFLERP